MKILWFSWKDTSHPEAGGAELILHELSKRLVKAGHEVTILTAQYPGAKNHDVIDGISIIRVGTNRYIHSFAALWYYLRHLRNRFDVIVEAVNTAPYFSPFFKGKAKAFLFYHQLAREIWFHETRAPLSHIGYYLLEPIATFIMGKTRATTITISESTKKDLQHFGFKDNRIKIISEGIELTPLPDLTSVKKYDRPTMLSLGSARAMKRTIDQLRAFEIAKKTLPDLQLKIAGDTNSSYGRELTAAVEASPYKKDIALLGWVSLQEKDELMKRSHLITVTSIKEGWGLIVTEANSQGTPAVVYDVDGLRDSVRHNRTGIVTAPHPEALAVGIAEILASPEHYQAIRTAGWEWSKTITFEQSYKDFMEIIKSNDI
ncbi:MAG TPA: glycosyltransferase family 4 protein [Verrucomicrobiae bacterium]|nr:glycosyltransferase family 4 protein [Verrucomicrobiae bacterium]